MNWNQLNEHKDTVSRSVIWCTYNWKFVHKTVWIRDEIHGGNIRIMKFFCCFMSYSSPDLKYSFIFHKSYPFPTKYSIEWRFCDTIIIWLYNVYIEHSKNRRNKKSHRYTGESKSRGNNAHYWEQIVHSRTESWEGNTKEIREYSKTCRLYLNILFYQLGLRCKLCWFIFSFFSSFPQFVFVFMLVTFRFEFMLRVEIYVVVVRSGLEWNTYWHFYQIPNNFTTYSIK